jgi:hypothetical protein
MPRDRFLGLRLAVAITALFWLCAGAAVLHLLGAL